jgi:ParB family chromosome partitioning protein
MVANMLLRMQGVLEPILIVKDGGEPVVIDGRQRVKALREANKILKEQGATPLQVPAILKRGDDNSLFAMSLSTNEQRVQDKPLEKAKKLVRLLNQGVSLPEAAVIFGVGIETVKRWETLSELGDDIKESIESGEVSATKAAALATKPRHKQKPKDVKKRAKGPRKKVEILEALDKADERTAHILRWVLREVDSLDNYSGPRPGPRPDVSDA